MTEKKKEKNIFNSYKDLKDYTPVAESKKMNFGWSDNAYEVHEIIYKIYFVEDKVIFCKYDVEDPDDSIVYHYSFSEFVESELKDPVAFNDVQYIKKSSEYDEFMSLFNYYTETLKFATKEAEKEEGYETKRLSSTEYQHGFVSNNLNF